MSDLIAQKRARLEQLKKEAAAKKAQKDRGTGRTAAGPRGQGGQAEDINELMDKVISSSAFEERKKKEQEEDQPPVQKLINTSLTVALDQ